MKGRRQTYRELEEANVSLTDAMTRLNFKIDRIIEEQGKINEDLSRMLRYYKNENSPPSSDSLEWKRQKAQRRKDTSTGTDGDKTDRRVSGGQKGYHGVSRQHSPQSEEVHTFKGAPGAQGAAAVLGLTGSRWCAILWIWRSPPLRRATGSRLPPAGAVLSVRHQVAFPKRVVMARMWWD